MKDFTAYTLWPSCCRAAEKWALGFPFLPGLYKKQASSVAEGSRPSHLFDSAAWDMVQILKPSLEAGADNCIRQG